MSEKRPKSSSKRSAPAKPRTKHAELRVFLAKLVREPDRLLKQVVHRLSASSADLEPKEEEQRKSLAKEIIQHLLPLQPALQAGQTRKTVKKIAQLCREWSDTGINFQDLQTVMDAWRAAWQDLIDPALPPAKWEYVRIACEDLWLQNLLGVVRGFLEAKDRVIREKTLESSVLFHTTQSITTDLNLQSLLFKIVLHTSMLLRVKQVFLFLVDRSGPFGKAERRLNLAAWNQTNQSYGEYSVRFGEGQVGKVAQSRQPMIQNDYGRSTERLPFLSEAHCLLLAPVAFSEEILGVLVAADDRRHEPFQNTDKELLNVFSTQIAVTLKNVLLYEQQSVIAQELEEKNRMLEAQSELVLRRSSQLVVINEVGQQVNSSLELGQVLDVLARHAAESIGVNRCVVWLMDERKIQLEAVAVHGLPKEQLKQLNMFLPDIRRSRFFQVLSEQHAVEISTGQDVDLFQAGLHGILGNFTMLAVPLIFKQQALGLLAVDDTRENHKFLEDEVNLISAIANQAVLAIENARLYQQVKEQAITDGLTGLYNRRYFQLRYTEEFANCKRYNTPMSIIMMDIDHFKKYNDTFGHIAGDLALKEISNLTRTSVRENDIVARYGGEEIVIIMPLTDLEGALALAERIRETVLGCRFLGDLNMPQVTISVSLGVAAYVDQYANREELLRDADNALYTAKTTGRNRVVVAPPPTRGNRVPPASVV